MNRNSSDNPATRPSEQAAPQSRPAAFSSADRIVVVFTALYMAVSLSACLLTGNFEFIFYFVVMCVLLAAVSFLHLRVGLRNASLWGLSIWGLAHMAGGLLPVPETWPIDGHIRVLYSLWLIPDYLKYDQLVHAYGFGLVTWICWQGIERGFLNHGIAVKPTPGLLTICVASGMGFGAANEVVEFIATLTMPQTNVGGYLNTGWDLVSNLVGCLIAAALIKMKWI